MDVLVRLGVVAAIAASFAFFRRRLPVRLRTTEVQTFQPEMESRFGTTQWTLGLALLVVGAALGFSLYAVCVELNHYYAALEGPARFQLLPTRVIWTFFPGFAALTTSWEITLILWAWVGDAKYISQYLDWSDRNAGFNSTVALRWMTLTIALPLGVATALALPMHSTLHENELHVRSYASLHSKVLRYADVRRIFAVAGERNRDGSVRVRAEIILEFRDGQRWHSGDNRDFERVVDPRLANFLQQKTGIQLQYLETEADIPREPTYSAK